MTQEALRFDAAINPYGCSPRVVEAMVAHARSKAYRFYGEPDAISLRTQLAAHFQLNPANFLVYNGAGEALIWQFVVHLLLPRRRLLAPYPSYERFVEAAKRCASEVVEVPLSQGDYSLPVRSFIEQGRRNNVSVALLSSPNNPTGNQLVGEDSLSELLEEMPDCICILDEAYADYSGTSFVPWVRTHRNLVVLRTFSKAYGLAGMRVGYLAAHPTVAERFAQFQIPWGVDSMALAAAQAALDDQAYLKDVVTRIRDNCTAFEAALRRVPYFEVSPSDANFFLVRLRDVDPAEIHQHLTKNRIQVRRRADMPSHIRITSMKPEENEQLIEAVASL